MKLYIEVQENLALKVISGIFANIKVFPLLQS